ncbi:MAG: OmpA family protein [Rhodospirillales bacterium]|nr:OmpA family protein [Rhodospirillales bacterium]
MASHAFDALRTRTSLKAALLAGVFAGVAAVGGCANVPDALNPAQWYRSTADVFSGDDKAKQAKQQAGKPSELKEQRGAPAPGADKPFPNLAQVDEKARKDDLSGGLSADPERPKYAPPIERQAPATSVLQARPTPPPAPAIAAAPRSPAAAPTTPVTPVPVVPPKPGEPAVVAAPEPPKLSAPPMSADQKDQQTRLTQQLADLRARAAEPSALPANAMVPSATGEFATIVVSADGIETADFGVAAAAPTTVGLPPGEMGGAMIENRGALPVPGSAVKVATILFDNGSSALKATDKQILSAVSRLQNQQGGVIRIVGHASSRTRNLPVVRHKMANFKISADRADVVAGELMRLGVAKDKIVVAAVSDAEPMYYEIMPSGEAGNRRTEIYLGN